MKMKINSEILNRSPFGKLRAGRKDREGACLIPPPAERLSLPLACFAPSVQTLLFVSGMLALLGVFSASAASIPVQQGFENFLDGTALNASSLTNQGWGASSNTVTIRTVSAVPDPVRGTNVLAIPEGLTASNVVTSVTPNTNVWVDMFVNTNMTMSVNLIGDESVDTNLTVEVFLNTNGCPVVWNPASNAWIVCSQDAWQTNVSVFNTSQWARITLCENYSNRTATLFMNEHLILSGLRFINTNKSSYSMFAADSGSALTSYVDEVSVTYAPPANMADVDDDGMSEAEEIQLYGNTTTWTWRTVSVAMTNHGTVTPFTPFLIRPRGQTNFSLTADVAYGVASVSTNSTPATSFAGKPRTASYTLTNVLADTTVAVSFDYTGLRLVPDDYPTLQAAVAVAQVGDTILASTGSFTNDVTVGQSLSLVGTNVNILGALNVSGGATGTLAGCVGMVVTGGVTVAGGALLVVSNGTVDVGALTILAGGTVQVVNVTAFTADGVTRTGTFTLDSGWGTSVVPQVPPYSDSFERYALGTKLSRMGYYGWDTASNNVVIQNTYAQSNQAVEIPARASLASAMTTTPASNVWFELYYQDTNRTPASMATLDIVDTNVAVMAFINTNGYVTVFQPVSNQWDVCSNDARGVSVSSLTNDAWVRITVNENYTRGRAAVFLNGRLLRQELRFINTNLVNSGRFHVESGISGSTYLDTYSVRTNWVGVVSDDRDDDAWPDAMEIDLYGNTSKDPGVGSVYMIR